MGLRKKFIEDGKARAGGRRGLAKADAQLPVCSGVCLEWKPEQDLVYRHGYRHDESWEMEGLRFGKKCKQSQKRRVEGGRGTFDLLNQPLKGLPFSCSKGRTLAHGNLTEYAIY